MVVDNYIFFDSVEVKYRMATFTSEKYASFSVNKLARPNILELTPYRCARDDYSEGILLDANENSIGPVVDSLPHLQLNRYPDPLHLELKEKVARFRGVQKEQIFFGVGSDEAIDILFRIFCSPGEDNVVITPPTYGMYAVCAKINDVAVKISPLTQTFDLSIPSILNTIDSKTKLVFICSPGNPTSKSIPNEDIIEVAKNFDGILVVDEAYVDFSRTPSSVLLLGEYPNIVVLQTLSKAFGLAGIRLGMAIGHIDVIQLMNNIKAPYNINKLTADIVRKSFDEALPKFHDNVNAILVEKSFLLSKLQALPAVKKIHHSDANFLLFSVPRAFDIYKTMADRGIVCRYR